MGMDGLLGVAGMIIDSYCGSFLKIPCVKRTSKSLRNGPFFQGTQNFGEYTAHKSR